MIRLIFALVLVSGMVQAQTSTTGTPSAYSSSRSSKTIGVFGTLQTSPASGLPTQEISVAGNFADSLRLSIGYGEIRGSNLNNPSDPFAGRSDQVRPSLGAQGQFMINGWSLSPVLGAGYTHALNSNFNATPDFYNVNAGVDWQTEIGLNLAGGLKRTVISENETSVYINGGWFF